MHLGPSEQRASTGTIVRLVHASGCIVWLISKASSRAAALVVLAATPAAAIRPRKAWLFAFHTAVALGGGTSGVEVLFWRCETRTQYLTPACVCTAAALLLLEVHGGAWRCMGPCICSRPVPASACQTPCLPDLTSSTHLAGRLAAAC